MRSSLSDSGRVGAILADRPPARPACSTGHGSAGLQLPGLSPLKDKVHAIDARIGGALADWLAGVFVVEGDPAPAARAGLPPGAVLVNREGHQFTRHTVSFHALDPADAGLLARQVEIEMLEKRTGELRAQLAGAEKLVEQAASRSVERNAALEEARLEISARPKARHDAQIEHLKLRRHASATANAAPQVSEEMAEIRREAESGTQALAACGAALAHIAGEIAGARTPAREGWRGHTAAEAALADQRRCRSRPSGRAGRAVRRARMLVEDWRNRQRGAGDRPAGRARRPGSIQTDRGTAADPIPAYAGPGRGSRSAHRLREDSGRRPQRGRGGRGGAARNRGSTAPGRGESGAAARQGPALRLKEQAAQISVDQYDPQLREANADEALLAGEAEKAPRPLRCREKSRASRRRSASWAR